MYVNIEKYITGILTDINPNFIFIITDDDNKVLKLKFKINKTEILPFLTKRIIARVVAEQHISNGNTKNYKLISIKEFNPKLEKFPDTTSSPWNGVPEDFIEKLRGN